MQDIQTRLDASMEQASYADLPGQTIALPTPVGVIKKMIADICDSLPFALGDVDIFGNQTPRAGRLQPNIKAVQGFALLWPMPIFSATQNEHATPAQEARARRALQRIASTHGIRLGMDLSSETIQVERMISPSSSHISELSVRSDSS